MVKNTFSDIVLKETSKEIPISEGNGETIISPAKMSMKYFFNKFGILLSKYTTIFSRDNFSKSSANWFLINLKIKKFPIILPKPPINAAKTILWSFAKIKKIAVAGTAVKPYAKSIPVRNALK